MSAAADAGASLTKAAMATADETHHTATSSESTSLNEKRLQEPAPQSEDAKAEQQLDDGEQIDYPVGVKLFLLALALCLSIFLVALDSTIIATAIPQITDQFHSLNDVGWYGSGK
jgi:hypothetical protein